MRLLCPLLEGFAFSRGHRRCEPLPPNALCKPGLLTPIVPCSYSGLGAYSLAPSLAAASPSLLSLTSNSSSGWSGLYSSMLAPPPVPAQIQLKLTVGDVQGLQRQVSAQL